MVSYQILITGSIRIQEETNGKKWSAAYDVNESATIEIWSVKDHDHNGGELLEMILFLPLAGLGCFSSGCRVCLPLIRN